jgi:serine/threonine protein kinase
MEYASNGSLRSFIERRLMKGGGIALSRQENLDLLRGIAAGMAHVQAQRVVHNDLSARNIFLDANNIPKIAGTKISVVCVFLF